MHRFYLPPDQIRSTVVILHRREAHHALHVLRIRPGESAIILDGAGHELLCEVQGVTRDEVQLGVKQRNEIPALPYAITLLQAVPKGKLFEAIIQKGTELGVQRIVPILSERVVPHLDSESSETKLEKWRLTAIEAVKQSGSAWLPALDPPVTLKDFLARNEQFELPLVASLRSDSRHPREWFAHFHTEHHRQPRSLCIWVGPEGDFSHAEMGAIRSAGALPITLGRLILRTETAAVYCLSILNYELQSPRLD
jgi:16S rRNA (uracil1498-N3)-methyltransferase